MQNLRPTQFSAVLTTLWQSATSWTVSLTVGACDFPPEKQPPELPC